MSQPKFSYFFSFEKYRFRYLRQNPLCPKMLGSFILNCPDIRTHFYPQLRTRFLSSRSQTTFFWEMLDLKGGFCFLSCTFDSSKMPRNCSLFCPFFSIFQLIVLDESSGASSFQSKALCVWWASPISINWFVPCVGILIVGENQTAF